MNIYTKCEKKYVVYPYNGIFSVLKRSEIIDTKNMQIKTKQIQKAMNPVIPFVLNAQNRPIRGDSRCLGREQKGMGKRGR